MLDVFSANPAFSITSLTLAMNRMPFVPGRIGELGLYSERRLSTTSTTIEVKNNRLAFVPSTPRGAPPALDVRDRRELVPFLIPHFPLSDTLMADSIQGVRAFGTEDTLEAITQKTNEVLGSMSMKHDVTLEYLRLGGVKGLVITRTNRDTGAPEVAIDLRNAFNMLPKPIAPIAADGIPYDFEWPIRMRGIANMDLTVLQTSAMLGDLTVLVMEMVRLMADRLGAQTFNHIHGIAGRNFFDAWQNHPEVRVTYLNQPSADRMRDPYWGRSITFREVTIEEYRGRVGAVEFVHPDYCHFFPVGVPDLFLEAYAPADYIETVNTIALPRYAKQEVIPFGKGIMFETQQNVLPICTMPDVLLTAHLDDFVVP